MASTSFAIAAEVALILVVIVIICVENWRTFYRVGTRWPWLVNLVLSLMLTVNGVLAWQRGHYWLAALQGLAALISLWPSASWRRRRRR